MSGPSEARMVSRRHICGDPLISYNPIGLGERFRHAQLLMNSLSAYSCFCYRSSCSSMPTSLVQEMEPSDWGLILSYFMISRYYITRTLSLRILWQSLQSFWLRQSLKRASNRGQLAFTQGGSCRSFTSSQKYFPRYTTSNWSFSLETSSNISISYIASEHPFELTTFLLLVSINWLRTSTKRYISLESALISKTTKSPQLLLQQRPIMVKLLVTETTILSKFTFFQASCCSSCRPARRPNCSLAPTTLIRQARNGFTTVDISMTSLLRNTSSERVEIDRLSFVCYISLPSSARRFSIIESQANSIPPRNSASLYFESAALPS